MAESETGKPKRKWRSFLITMAVSIGYMIPLFWLWSQAGWPNSFGIAITARGKAGLMENWYYSYLLLRRPSLIDDATFVYMWIPVVGLVGWLGRAFYRDMRAKRASGADRERRS